MKIGILSRGSFLYSTQALVRAGTQRQHEMYVIDHSRCQFLLEKNKVQIFHEGQSLEHLNAIIPRIGASVTSLGVTAIRHFELLNIFSTVKPEVLLQTRDKMRCLQQLAMAGIAVPRTVMVNASTNLASVIDFVGGLPVVLKLPEGTHGTGVILIDNRQTAESTIDAFLRMGQRILLQEFIPEANGSDIRALVVAGKVVTAMRRQAQEGEFRSNLHLGATAEKVWLSPKEQLLVEKVARLMKLDVAGIDFLYSNRGPLILEVNASPGLEGIERVSGEDVAGEIIRYVERQVKKTGKAFQRVER